jgi:hypothetical protein
MKHSRTYTYIYYWFNKLLVPGTKSTIHVLYVRHRVEFCTCTRDDLRIPFLIVLYIVYTHEASDI